jgi:hypothetical protein
MKPTITARFVRDAHGQPQCVIDATGMRHFSIELGIAGAPDHATRVIYRLHDSYFDPIREARPEATAGSTRFAERITSYGDFELSARIETPAGPVFLRESLSKALQKGEASSIAQDVTAEALKLIEEH